MCLCARIECVCVCAYGFLILRLHKILLRKYLCSTDKRISDLKECRRYISNFRSTTAIVLRSTSTIHGLYPYTVVFVLYMYKTEVRVSGKSSGALGFA